ncbi:MAG: hypothetical protein ABII74_08005 [Elusimicrobiota bacterium]
MEMVKVQVTKALLAICNQVYEIEQRLKKTAVDSGIQRNITKLKDALRELNLLYEDPSGQKYNETRSDLDATISGERTDGLVVVEVIKPIIRYRTSGAEGQEFNYIVQKGVVIVQNKEAI